MNWIVIIWSMSAAVSLTLGAIYFVVWFQDRKALANLLFSFAAWSVAVFAGFELALMRAATVAQFAVLHRWMHVPLFFAIVSLVWFIAYYFHSGRRWLAWVVVGLRVVVLAINFLTTPSFNFREITALAPFSLLGETVSAPVGLRSPWAWLGEGSALLALGFVLGAARDLWRRGDPEGRRRALVVGGSVSVCVSLSILNGLTVHLGLVHAPYFVSLCFVLIIIAMAWELSRDVIRAAKMVDQLRENSESMALAARAAGQALWRWDIACDTIWFSPGGRRLFGIADGADVTLGRLVEAIHPEDRERVRDEVRRALAGAGEYRADFRVVLPDGGLRWFEGSGRVEFDGNRKPVLMRGVSIDGTERKTMEAELTQRRAEVAHLTRVSALSELSGSLAHELNQPLGIILSNAQAAQDLVANDPHGSAEMAEILADIVAADRRAGEVIQRLRNLLRRGETSHEPLAINQVIAEVMQLTRVELIGRGVTLTHDLNAALPQVAGDAVQLQQVVLNLILNAADAVASNPRGQRRIHLATTGGEGAVRVSVRDDGGGLPADIERLFQPFVTTKAHGLGLGLAICRSIITAHHGRVWAAGHAERGAVFNFELPAVGVEDLS